MNQRARTLAREQEIIRIRVNAIAPSEEMAEYKSIKVRRAENEQFGKV